jgi:hypothetical protein
MPTVLSLCVEQLDGSVTSRCASPVATSSCTLLTLSVHLLLISTDQSSSCYFVPPGLIGTQTSNWTSKPRERERERERDGRETGKEMKWLEEDISERESNLFSFKVSQVVATRRSGKCSLEIRMKCWEVKFSFFNFISIGKNFHCIFNDFALILIFY